ncbi:hypothetical protein AOLI_G00097730 [Acnodon oligacanthus]
MQTIKKQHTCSVLHTKAAPDQNSGLAGESCEELIKDYQDISKGMIKDSFADLAMQIIGLASAAAEEGATPDSVIIVTDGTERHTTHALPYIHAHTVKGMVTPHLNIKVVQNEDSKLVWNVVPAQGLLNQFVGYGPIGVCEIQPQHHQVPLVLPGFPDQLCDHACVLQTPWHLWDPSFLDRGVNIRIPQEVVSQAPGNNAEEYLSLNTEQ